MNFPQSNIDTTNPLEWLAQISAMQPGPERDEQVETFLYSQLQFSKDLAQRVRHQWHHLDMSEAHSVVLVSMYETVREEIEKPGSVTKTEAQWGAIATTRARLEARKRFRTETDSVTSPTDVRRNQFLAACVRDFVATHQKEPTPRELMEFANDRAARTRRDPKRQSLWFTLQDTKAFTHTATVSSQRHYDLLNSGGEPGDTMDGDYILSPFETPDFVATVVEQCNEKDPTLGLVARTMYGSYLQASSSESHVLSPREVSEKLGLTINATRRKITAVKEVAVSVLERYGITPQDV